MLPSKIKSKMTKTEIATHKRLLKEVKNTANAAQKAQAISTNYMRKLAKMKNPSASATKKDKTMIINGFRLEYIAGSAVGTLNNFEEKMKKKHNKKK